MIYKDKYAYFDRDHMPANRGAMELCVHCGKEFSSHNGWACHPWEGKSSYFSRLEPNSRYATPLMLKSIGLHCAETLAIRSQLKRKTKESSK